MPATFAIENWPLAYEQRLDARPASAVDLVVIHCTELPDMPIAREYGERIRYVDKGTGNSGHYYVDRDGKVFRSVLRAQLISDADFHKALREHDMVDVSDVALALLETNGSISVVPRQDGGNERAAHYLAYFDKKSRESGPGDASDSQSRGRK